MRARKVTEDKLRRAERLRAVSHEPTWEGYPDDLFLFRTLWPGKPEPIESRQRVRR